jgi:hypothetical protein
LRLRFSPSPSLFRFGEALFTVGRWKPQGQKTQTVTFFSCLSISLRNLGVDENFGTSEPLFAQHCCGHLGRLGQIGADPPLGSSTRQGLEAGLLGNLPRFLWPSPVLAVIPPCATSNRGGQDEFTPMESGIP